MARQVRIEYSGAFYHVFSRGNQKQDTFYKDEDRHYFLNCLREAWGKFGAVIHAYCLMPNHYHLLMETPSSNLSRIMHMINTSYSIYFNTKNERCGHLFQGRYKAILVQADVYACELSRYIHLNPVRTRLVPLPEAYFWSSFREYLGNRNSPPWLNTRFTLNLFGEPPGNSRRYAQFVQDGMRTDAPTSLRESMKTGVLGDRGFIEKIKSNLLKNQLECVDRERPQLRNLMMRPDPVKMMALAESYFGRHNKHARSVAILMMHTHSGLTLREIACFFNMSLSGISNACRRMRAELDHSESFSRAFRAMEREACDRGPSGGQIYLLSKSNKR